MIEANERYTCGSCQFCHFIDTELERQSKGRRIWGCGLDYTERKEGFMKTHNKGSLSNDIGNDCNVLLFNSIR